MQSISRRQLALGSLIVPASKVLASGQALSVVVTGAHPGDPEYGCGGMIARYAEAGSRVAIVYLNHGDKGCGTRSPEDCAAVRTREAERACQILNARPVFAGQRDGDSVIDDAHTNDFCKLIEAQAPDILFTHWPIDNHPDHRTTSLLAYSVWQRLHKRFAFYFYEVSDGEDTVMFSPTDYVDISRVLARKRAACYAHASQAPDKFWALQSKVTAFRGIEAGYKQAEAFARHAQSHRAGLP